MDSTIPAHHSGLRWGLALGGFLVAYGVFFRITGLRYDSAAGWIFYVALPVGALLAMHAACGTTWGSFPRLLLPGSIAVLVGAALYSASVFVYNGFIDDSLLQTIRTDQADALAARGLPPEAIRNRLEQVELLTRPGNFSVAVFVQLSVFGLISCVILAAILRWIERRRHGRVTRPA